MIRRLVSWLAAAAVALLAGCATTVGSDLTVFHDWPADAPRSYRLARLPGQQDSLEHATFENLLRPELAAAGFAERPDGRFEIVFEYSVLQRVRRGYYYPYFAPYFTVGTWGSHGGVTMGGPWPWWGPGYYPDTLVFDRRLRIEIRDTAAAPPRKVYEGTAVSEGITATPLEAFPLMARAILKEFPGPSGVTRRVEVPMPSKTAP